MKSNLDLLPHSPPASPSLSVIIPVLNEEANIETHLRALRQLRLNGAEVLVVDGGSADRTVELARAFADAVLAAPRGRATQMNAGARHARGAILVFLHADTLLPAHADETICQALAKSRRVWGRFNIRLQGRPRTLPLIAAMMNLRSRASGIATGDQCLFVRREAFEVIGGFPEIALMEDVAISKRLKRLSRPICLREKVTSSGRMWEKEGVIRTVLTMWRLRLAYLCGADPANLSRIYYGS